jgi:cytoskeletal protein CcmA (bactofilin family)
VSVRNIKTSQASRQRRRTQKLESAAPTGFSSVTRGQFRIASVEGLLVEGSASVSGRLEVSGIEVVSGQLRVTGSLVVAGNADVTGPMTVSGPLTVNGETTFVGPLTIEGETTVVGTLMVEGDVTFTGKTVLNGETELNGDTKITGKTELIGDTKLSGNLDVVDDGKIQVGTILLDPRGGDNGLGSISSPRALELRAATVVSQADFFVEQSLTVEGSVDVPGLQVIPNKAANVHIDSNGRLWRVV